MGLFGFFKNKFESAQMDLDDFDLASFFGSSSAPEDVPVHTKRSRSEFRQGCTRHFSYTVRKYCGDCEGSGESVKGSSRQCEYCEDGNTLLTPLGPMAVLCNICHGRGYIITNPCNRCSGNGWTEIEDYHEVDIPPYFREQRLTIPGKGHYVDLHTRGALVVLFRDAGKYAAAK